MIYTDSLWCYERELCIGPLKSFSGATAQMICHLESRDKTDRTGFCAKTNSVNVSWNSNQGYQCSSTRVIFYYSLPKWIQ